MSILWYSIYIVEFYSPISGCDSNITLDGILIRALGILNCGSVENGEPVSGNTMTCSSLRSRALASKTKETRYHIIIMAVLYGRNNVVPVSHSRVVNE